MPGHGELLPAAHASRLNEDDVAPGRRPDQTDGNAGLFDTILDLAFGAEARNAESFANHLRRHHHLVGLTLCKTASLLSCDRGDLAFQIADTGFTRVAMDHFAQAVVCELDLLSHLQAVLARLLGDEVPVRNVDLLDLRVAGELDNLHAVTQRLRDRIDPVGRSDKED